MSKELDARVAEKVMGLVVNWNYPASPYSTDMNVATGVMLSLVKDIDFEIITNMSNNMVLYWQVTATVHTLQTAQLNHPSLPTAICLAALRVVGDKDWVVDYLRETNNG